MFVLRRITSDNLESNTILGEDYVLITEERNPEDFKKSAELMKWGKAEIDNVYGFLDFMEERQSLNHGGLLPLYKKSTYFVMVGNGQTFANITHR